MNLDITDLKMSNVTLSKPRYEENIIHTRDEVRKNTHITTFKSLSSAPCRESYYYRLNRARGTTRSLTSMKGCVGVKGYNFFTISTTDLKLRTNVLYTL